MMKKINNISDRISYIIENQCHGNQKKFADKINFAPQVIYNIVSGRRSKPSFDVLEAILSSFDEINAQWLLTGEGKMLKNSQWLMAGNKNTVIQSNNHTNGNNILNNNSTSEELKDKEIELLKKEVALYKRENDFLKQEIEKLKEM